MRRLLSGARFLTLLLPLYCLCVCIQSGCGGTIVNDGTTKAPVTGAGDDAGDGSYGPYGTGYYGGDDGIDYDSDDDYYGHDYYRYGSP